MKQKSALSELAKFHGGPTNVFPTVPKALKSLNAMELELRSPKTKERIDRIILAAEAWKILLGDIFAVKKAAEWVILFGNRRIGQEIGKILKVAGGDRKSKLPKRVNLKSGRGAIGIPGTSRARLVNLAKEEESTLRQVSEFLWNLGKDATVRGVVSELSHQRAMHRRRATKAPPLPDGMDLRIGDCRKVLADIKDNSVALVLTDPPYPAEAEPLYQWLAEWSARVLIPGGSLICYTGHWSLNRDVKIFDEHLRYWWVMAMLHRQSRRLPGKFIIANFKPVLWYVKDFRRGRVLIPDILFDAKREKLDHEWGQGEAGVLPLIESLTEPGEMVLDPFAGTATWGRIAASIGRRWIGSDIVQGGTTDIKSDEEAA